MSSSRTAIHLSFRFRNAGSTSNWIRNMRPYLQGHIAPIWEIFLYWLEKSPSQGTGQMSRAYTPKVVTANALIEGDVVYLNADERWTRDHAEAEMIDDAAPEQLCLLMSEHQKNSDVGT